MHKSFLLSSLLIHTLPASAARRSPLVVRSLRPYSTQPSTSTTIKSSNLSPGLAALGAAVIGVGVYSYLGNNQTAPIVKNKMTQEVIEKPSALSKDDWRDFKLLNKLDYNYNSAIFTFAVPEHTSGAIPTASCLLIAMPGDKGPVARPYTPITAPGVDDRIDILIKKYDSGNVSKFVHELAIGESLKMKGHIPKFKYEPNQFEEIVLIAGGSGITPMYQVLQTINSNPSDKTRALLIFSNRTEKDILLRKEFEELEKKNSGFKKIFTLDQAPEGWSGHSGYLTKEFLEKVLPSPDKGQKIKIFVCGPPPQMDAISGNKKSPSDQGELKGFLKELGYSDDQVFKF